jgi:RsiW-degrading membrane proteinase PrsW (M82 family)
MGLIKYKTLYLWMIIPMLFMQFGIFEDYWGDFSDNAWSVHIHYWTGTIWYIYLITQPYFATRGQLARHRTNGIIGMFIAGGVSLTALSMLHRDIVTTERALATPEQFGPFQPYFFFGVAAVEIVMMTAFVYAVIKSIIHRKELEDHAWWLVSTVFLIMMPALGRGVQNVYIDIHRTDWPNIDIMLPIYLTQLIIIAMLFLGAWKYGKLKHPATLVALGVNLFIFLLEPIGKSETIQILLKTIIKG